MRMASPRTLPAALAVFCVTATSTAAAGSEYPVHLLLADSDVPQSDTAAKYEESMELALVRAMDVELFPLPAPAVALDPLGLGGELVVHDGPAQSLLALLGVPLPVAKAPVTAPPLLSQDLSWLEGLSMPDLPVRWDDKVIVYLDRYRNDGKWRKIIRSWMSRTERYGPAMRKVLSEHGMPEDLTYLAMIESGYNPRAVSSAGAVGLWQFMPATGEEYGLTRSKWVDQRRNPELSTIAAAEFLSRLEERFGTWDLAMAAYNMGPTALLASEKKYNTNDYWKLAGFEAGLPWGTSNYVPKILAAAIVGNNREAFGMDDLVYEKPIAYDVAIVSVSCKLSQIAQAAGVGASQVVDLNPELLKARVPPDVLPYPVRIPAGSGPDFEKGWPEVSSKLGALVPYEVKFGDTLTRIAKIYSTTTKELAEINDISKKDVLAAGETILVPAGEPAVIDPGDPVTVGVPAVQFVYPGHRRVFYEIVGGDTLWAIAVFFQVTVDDLCAWNGMDPAAAIHPGMFLQIFVPAGRDLSMAVILEEDQVVILEVNSVEFLEYQASLEGKMRIVHTVTEGETLQGIAKQYSVKVSSIVRINQFGYDTQLVPGQEIVLYVDAGSGENASL